MTFKASLLARDASNRVKTLLVASYPNPSFNGGTPASLLQELVINTGAAIGTPVFKGGIAYEPVSGAVLVSDAGTPATWHGGLPVDAAGRLVVAINGTVARYNAGIPFDANGRVVLATPGSIVNLSAFSSAFSSAFG